MFERKITWTIKNKEKRELLAFFNQATGKRYKEIRNVTKFYGLNSPLETYEHLRELYNDEVGRRRGETKTAEKEFYKRNVYEIKVRENKEYDLFGLIRERFNQLRGKSVIFQYIVDRKYVRNNNYDIPLAGFSDFWKQLSAHDLMVSSDVTVFEDNDMKGKVLIFEQRDDIKPAKVKQLFRDGINHCVFEPIKKWAENILNDNPSKRTMERYRAIVNHCKNFIDKYNTGVAEDDFPEICRKLQVNIEIQLPFMEKTFLKYESERKALRTFKFLNTRVNHLEVNNVVCRDNYKEISLEQMNELKEDLDTRGEFYTFKRGRFNIVEISTLYEVYKINGDYGKIVSDFEISTGLCYCKIDDIGDAELSSFVKEGTHYNETVDFKDVGYIVHYEPTNEWKYDKLDVKHLDMAKAYTNFKKCKWYSGFLGKITDFRRTDSIQGEGLYRITNLDFVYNSAFKKLNDKMKMYMNNNVYTSPELRFLTSIGVKYKIVEGCWGVEKFEFDFNEDMIEKEDDEGTSYYARWVGACDQHKLTQKFWMNADEDYYKVLDAEEYAKVKWYETQEACIEFQKEHNFHLGHISAFITAYQRLSTLEQLMAIPYDNLIRICVDGIYFIDCEVEVKNVFRYKDKCNFGNIAGDGYMSNVEVKPFIHHNVEFRENHKRELHLGEGGCGKTHYNLNDKGFVKPLFVAPSWKLARNKQKETGMRATVWARVSTIDPEQISKIKKYNNVLIVDEISMMTEEQKQLIFSNYPDMKIIMCGDLGFQLPCIKLKESDKDCDTSGFDFIKKYNSDYRCTCPVLKDIKKKLRHMIKNNSSYKKAVTFITSSFKNVTMDELKEMYKIEDMILCRTNITKDAYTAMFTGKFANEKYYVTENCKSYCNGEIVIGEKPSQCQSEVRHCFTTHSIQGETAEHRLFIDLERMKCIKMMYTAVSRARKMEQIFVIKK